MNGESAGVDPDLLTPESIAQNIIQAVGQLALGDLILRNASLAAARMQLPGVPIHVPTPLLFTRSVSLKFSYLIVENDNKPRLRFFSPAKRDRIAGFRLTLMLDASVQGGRREDLPRQLVYHPPAFVLGAEERDGTRTLSIRVDDGEPLIIRIAPPGDADGTLPFEGADAREGTPALVRLLRTLATWASTDATGSPRPMALESRGDLSTLPGLFGLMLDGYDTICASVANVSDASQPPPPLAGREATPAIKDLWGELCREAKTLHEWHGDLVGGFVVSSVVSRLLVDLSATGELLRDSNRKDRGQQIDLEIAYDRAEPGHLLHLRLRAPDILASGSPYFTSFLGAFLDKGSSDIKKWIKSHGPQSQRVFDDFIADARTDPRSAILRIDSAAAHEHGKSRDTDLFFLQARKPGRIGWVIFRAFVEVAPYPDMTVTHVDDVQPLLWQVDGVTGGALGSDEKTIAPYVRRLAGILATWQR